jgi:hypothetical protein
MYNSNQMIACRLGRIRGIIRSIQEQDHILDSWKHDKAYRIWIRYYKRKNPHIGYESSRLKNSLKGIPLKVEMCRSLDMHITSW